ncbi:MAG: FAD-dependent oxidoreductase [Hymenobacteraceae bacterium]|nr:FAD-dependent oxidoreductase [Hymenobacteraceae bacterium]
MAFSSLPILIIGGGAAGLAAARTLHAASRPFRLLEAAGHLGGRLRTTRHPEGFLLDHGFQILLTSYPEARRWLGDYAGLELRAFRSGARVRVGAEWCTVLNPLKEGVDALGHLGGGLATWPDRLRLARLAAYVARTSTDVLLAHAPGQNARRYLRDYGFSEQILDRFFRPFFGGVFLDRDLTPAAGLLLFLFKQFLTTDAALPAGGIQAVGEALAAPLPVASLRLHAPVARLDGLTAVLASGERVAGYAILLATDARTAARLLGAADPAPDGFRATTVAYYAASVSPGQGSRLLDLAPADNSGRLVHNVAVPSDVQPTYAPAGQALISVSSHGPAAFALPTDAALDAALRAELAPWYGTAAVRAWRWLGAYHLPEALPIAEPPGGTRLARPGVWVCGDHVAYPSFNAALASGRQAAEAVLKMP